MEFNVDIRRSCLNKNYISFKFSKLHINSNLPIAVKVAPNSSIVSISDREELEFTCQTNINLYNSKTSSYVLTYYNKGLFSKQFVWKNDEKYIIQLCRGKQLQQSQVYNGKETKVFYYLGMVVFVQLQIQEVKIYDFHTSLNNYKIIKLPEKITQVMQFGDQIILLPQNNNYIYVTNSQKILLPYFIKFENQYKESSILYFKQNNLNYLIQYEKNLYIIFQEFHSSISFIDHIIIHALIEQSLIVIYAIDKLQNRLIKYLYSDQELISSEYIDLNQYQKQIYFPLKVQYNKGKIVILTNNESGEFFLLIFKLSIYLAQGLEQIIEISRIEFFITEQFIFFYDKDFKTQIFQFEYLEFKMDIENLNQDQNLIELNQSFIYYSQIYPFKEFNFNFTISISNFCINIRKLPTSQQILHRKQQSTTSLTLQDYFSGPIEKVKLLDTTNLNLHGPFLYREKLQQCNPQQDLTLCIETRILQYQEDTTLKIYLVQIENQYKILNDCHLSLNIPIIQIFYLEQDQFLVIQNYLNMCIFVFYEFNLLDSRYFQKSVQTYECGKELMVCKKEGNILMLKFEKLARFFLILQQQVTEIHFQSQHQFNDFFIINNAQNQFVFLKNNVDFSTCLMSVYYLDQNQLFFNSSYKLDNSKFQSELLQNELRLQIQFTFTIITYKSFKMEEQCIISKIVIITQRTIFTGFAKCFMQEKECIYSVTKTLKIPHYIKNENKLQFDEDFIFISLNYNYYLYDLKLKKNLHYIASLQSDYQILTFNTTHYLIAPMIQQGNIYLGQIGYELSLSEFGLSKKEFEFDLLVQNEISEEQVSLIFLNDDLDVQTWMITKYLICSVNMIFIILMIYLNRRSKLKLKNQAQKTNDKC
ncbi:unnamed protein product [Paramecium octaurelia]|uniref:Transmembrane protein n=1 Tax=Paramecium octaurelia TaxID=43137 RepID=A0A8S1Y4E0_PAROT|nr:unnamed protein product [Paramecium octaurelia]